MTSAAVEEALASLPDVRAFLAARCRDADLAEELSQEVAARVVAAGPRLDRDGNLRSYLYRVAHNVWRDWLRRELVRRQAQARAEAPAPAPPADSELLAGELAGAAARAISALPRPMRDVILLRHREGLPFRAIAERLERPLGTVLSQMHEAMKRVQKAVEPYR